MHFLNAHRPIAVFRDSKPLLDHCLYRRRQFQVRQRLHYHGSPHGQPRYQGEVYSADCTLGVRLINRRNSIVAVVEESRCPLYDIVCLLILLLPHNVGPTMRAPALCAPQLLYILTYLSLLISFHPIFNLFLT